MANVVAAPSAPTSRLGGRLIEAGYINEAQCSVALEYQQEHKCLFGSALINLGYITQAELEHFFSESGRSRCGENLLSEGIVTREQLTDALSFQAEFGGRLGNAIVALGYASSEKVDAFFSKNIKQNNKKLGELLLESGFLTAEQIDQALLLQRNSGGQLGEVILSLGLLSEAQLYSILAKQMQVGRIGAQTDFTHSKKLPYEIALKNNSIIINSRNDVYILAVYRMLEDDAILEISRYLDKPVEQVLATIEEIESFWELVYHDKHSEDSVYKLYDEQPENSAIVTLSKGQRIVGITLLLLFLFFLIFDYSTVLYVLNIVVSGIYSFFTILKVVILFKGFKKREELRYTQEQIMAIDERELPVYTLLIPAYKEAEVIQSLVNNIENLDYPKHKLDIRILLEEDDKETLAALQIMNLPFYYTIIVVPDTKPHTKPKACNYGLIHARGDLVVIYDAEDMPESDQLKKAYLAFKDLPKCYVCVQSKLNYFNSSQNILTKWFTQEYSTWFDVLLIGTMTLDSPIPLGGTSNHFKADFLREVGAWDPFNVTEDADLGVRLYKLDYKTAVLDSHTWEEANSNVFNWIRQRSRWIKGYMQTWLVHMREPLKLYKELGFSGFVGYQAMVLGTPMIPILNPFFWTLLIIWYIFKPGFIDDLYPGALYYIALAQLVIGNFVFIYSNIFGAYAVIRESEIRGEMHIPYSILLVGIIIPIYWVLMSVAAYKALFQLFKNPFYWEKTNHGLTSSPTSGSIVSKG